jgi:hypothetical protein
VWTQTLGYLAQHTTQAGGYSWTSAVQTAAAALAGVAILVGAYKATIALLRQTFLSRRDLAHCINQLACGTTIEYTDSILGPPAFRRALGPGHEEHVYRTRHAWVQTIIQTADKSTESFAITITDPRFTLRTRELTGNMLDIRLGRTRFSDVPDEPDGYRIIRGANRFTHAESHYFGNPGNYQTYVLAHNDAGSGAFHITARDPLAGYWITGRLRQGADARPSWDQPPDWVQEARPLTTINTMLICQSTGDDEPKALTLDWIGADYGIVRVLPTLQRRKQLREHRKFMRKINKESGLPQAPPPDAAPQTNLPV